MIKIKKNDQIPDILTGEKATNALRKIESMIQAMQNPKSEDFDSGIFNGRGVKSQLLQDQNQKCAFCEVSMAGDYGVVEHYRPKTGWKENEADSLHHPGYYWLAYEWANLLCSCDKCNSTARKGNLFPLRDLATRDIPHQDISREVPLIINPANEDPGLSLRFNKYIAVPSIIEGNESDKGRNTIEIFDLNGCIPRNTTPARKALLNARITRWQEAKALYEAYIFCGMNRNDAIERVKDIYAQPEKQFSGMFCNQDMWF